MWLVQRDGLIADEDLFFITPLTYFFVNHNRWLVWQIPYQLMTFIYFLWYKGIVVALDKRSGGSTVDEFRRFAIEQTRARIMTPGPIPIIWYDSLTLFSFFSTCLFINYLFISHLAYSLNYLTIYLLMRICIWIHLFVSMYWQRNR